MHFDQRNQRNQRGYFTQISRISQIFIQVLLCSASCTIDLRNLREKEKTQRECTHADLADLADFYVQILAYRDLLFCNKSALSA